MTAVHSGFFTAEETPLFKLESGVSKILFLTGKSDKSSFPELLWPLPVI